MRFIVYSTVDGHIRCNLDCTPEDALLNCGENEAFMPGYVDDSQFKVDLDTGDIIAVETTENG